MKKKTKKRSAGGKKRSRVWAYPAEFRLKVIRLFLEEGYPSPPSSGRASTRCDSPRLAEHKGRRT